MFFDKSRKFLLDLRSFAAHHVDVLLAGLAFVSTSATSQSVFVGSIVSGLGLVLLVWLNGYPQKDVIDINCFAGPYRFVRYPAVLSRCLIMVGLLLASRQPFLYCLAVLILTPLYHRLSRSEDDTMTRELGPAASEYRALVSGLIPQLLPAKILGVSGHRIRDPFSLRRALVAKNWEAVRVTLLVVFFLLGHFIWAARIFTEVQWRSGALVLTSLAVGLFLKSFHRKAGVVAR